VSACLAVRYRERLQRHPLGLRNELELVEQAGLAHPRLRHRCHDLPVARLGEISGAPERIHLMLTTDELCQSAARGAVQPGAQPSQADDLEDLHRVGYPFNLGLSQSPQLEVSLREYAGMGADDR